MPKPTREPVLPTSESRKALLSPLDTHNHFPSTASSQLFMVSPVSYSHDSPRMETNHTPSPLRSNALRSQSDARDAEGAFDKVEKREGQYVSVESVDEPDQGQGSTYTATLPPLGESSQLRESSAKPSRTAKGKGRANEDQDESDGPIWTEEDAYLEREQAFFASARSGKKAKSDEKDPETGEANADDDDEDDPMLTDLRKRMDKIMDVQTEIHGMHQALETGRWGGDETGSGAGAADGKPEGHKEAEGANPAEAEEREKKRQEGMDRMFDKLADLSTMVRAYHALPQPSLFFPSYAATESSTPSPNTPSNPFRDPGTPRSLASGNQSSARHSNPTSSALNRPAQLSHAPSKRSFVNGRKEKEPRPVVVPMSSPELDVAGAGRGTERRTPGTA